MVNEVCYRLMRNIAAVFVLACALLAHVTADAGAIQDRRDSVFRKAKPVDLSNVVRAVSWQGPTTGLTEEQLSVALAGLMRKTLNSQAIDASAVELTQTLRSGGKSTAQVTVTRANHDRFFATGELVLTVVEKKNGAHE